MQIILFLRVVRNTSSIKKEFQLPCFSNAFQFVNYCLFLQVPKVPGFRMMTATDIPQAYQLVTEVSCLEVESYQSELTRFFDFK